MEALPGGNYLVHSLYNVLYIRMNGRFDTGRFLEMNAAVVQKRREFGGTAFLQILDLSAFDLDDPDAMAVISDKANDPHGINPASSVVVADSERLREKMHTFYTRPDRPVYPVTYRDSCEEAFRYFVEQGLLGEEKVEKWRSELKELV